MGKVKLFAVLVAITLMFSCEKDEPNVPKPNKYPKEVTIELKVFSPKNEEVNAHIFFFQDYVKEGEKVATLVEKIDLDDASLPFYKKDKRMVHYMEQLNLTVVVKDELKEVLAELLVDGKIVAKKSSFEAKKTNEKINGIGMVYHFK